jgi:hypothetical protein
MKVKIKKRVNMGSEEKSTGKQRKMKVKIKKKVNRGSK